MITDHVTLITGFGVGFPLNSTDLISVFCKVDNMEKAAEDAADAVKAYKAQRNRQV